jgi:hypothetical protein
MDSMDGPGDFSLLPSALPATLPSVVPLFEFVRVRELRAAPMNHPYTLIPNPFSPQSPVPNPQTPSFGAQPRHAFGGNQRIELLGG